MSIFAFSSSGIGGVGGGGGGFEPGSGDPVGETKFLVFIAPKKVETRGKEKFFSLHNDKFVLDRFFVDLSKQQRKTKNDN